MNLERCVFNHRFEPLDVFLRLRNFRFPLRHHLVSGGTQDLHTTAGVVQQILHTFSGNVQDSGDRRLHLLRRHLFGQRIDQGAHGIDGSRTVGQSVLLVDFVHKPFRRIDLRGCLGWRVRERYGAQNFGRHRDFRLYQPQFLKQSHFLLPPLNQIFL